jgi:dTMP kinase
MAKRRGTFIIVDGIDGSGKGTVVDAYATWAHEKGLRIFDVRAFAKEHQRLPEPAEWQGSDIIISAEPTHCGVGRVIREEIIKDNDRHYTGRTAAEAFALDRLVLHVQVILPALEAGLLVLQERGVSSSIAYQPLQKLITLAQLLKLEGNQFALEHRPDLLLIPVCPVSVALKRLSKRTKKDHAIFEKRAFLTKLDARYRSPWFAKIFRSRGSVVGFLDTDDALAETQKEAVGYMNDFLTRKSNGPKIQ